MQYAINYDYKIEDFNVIDLDTNKEVNDITNRK